MMCWIPPILCWFQAMKVGGPHHMQGRVRKQVVLTLNTRPLFNGYYKCFLSLSLCKPMFSPKTIMNQCPGRFLSITSQYPSVLKSNRLHVQILSCSLIKLGILYRQSPLNWSVIFLQSWTSAGYFSHSTGSSVTNCRFSPIIGMNVCFSIWTT